ncbi:hypothetical protein HUE56_29410 (plasmid) [Azospirillum oryzae]|uniref:Uncharacterized protein n=1 Tax=Azospirillum oryzae TaxID=286727 RepID=A0A6N1ASQ2_9PROT|nr:MULTISPECIES: hypothetical protein [Azospirillum]KAA0585471.1 hypothetical protein FZ938_26225 [Azospirillum oryzae]QCG99171.1 hypothetical protein E6C67_35865 [Azospirillum sp. TSA2s]QKS54626.1 hypothetical protein HUE56_29410 [Azospirillum oryzae]GLR77508.1 hypothetical protein GCM10007856_01760 [Azospirillum oryzae]
MGHTPFAASERLALTHMRIDHRAEVACARIARLFGGHYEGAQPAHIVGTISNHLGGDLAVARVPEGYPGTCAMFYSGRSGTNCAVFPTYSEAAIAARMAIDPTIGGYGEVILDAGITAPTDAMFFISAAHWLN